MKRIFRHKVRTAILLGVMVMALLYTNVFSQFQNLFYKEDRPVTAMDTAITNTDSIEVIGIPTTDDPWEEVEQLVNAYYSNSGITYKGTVKVIDDNGEKEKIIEEQPFEYTGLNENFHYRLGNMEFIDKKKYLLAVDHDNKMIGVTPKFDAKHENKLFDIGAFKKLMEEKKAHARVTKSGDEKILTIDNIGDPQIQGYRIYYSPQTYRISKMLIGMARYSPLEEETDVVDKAPGKDPVENQEQVEEEGVQEYYYYLEIIYNSTRQLSLKEKDFNPEDKFIKISNGKVELMPSFNNYQLFNAVEP